MRELKGEKLEQELARLAAMRAYENEYAQAVYIGGVDEAGRGPLAGPVVAACCVLQKDVQILYLNDSKKLSEKRRDALFDEIREKALAYGIGFADERCIDEINILQATYSAMRAAVGQVAEQLGCLPDVLLNDAVTIPALPPEIMQVPIVKGDAKSVSIAAASVLAKVTRDRLMIEYDKTYPQYGFAKHKGYGTRQHTDAIRMFGPCPIHRKTFITKFLN